MAEQWKNINDIDFYQVSNCGNVKSLDRVVYFSDGRKRFYKGKCLKNHIGKNGYYYTNIYGKRYEIHRLVYKVFIGEVPKNFEVHHKNHDKLDNRVENLGIIETSEHRKFHYNEHKHKLIDTKAKTVLQFDINGYFIKEYNSVKCAKDITGIAHISDVCLGKYKTAGGFIWKYKENNKKDMKYEYVYTSSDLCDDEAMHMSGNLEFSSTTETRV